MRLKREIRTYHVVDFIHAHEPGSKLKHVVAQRDNDELSVFGALLDITGNDRDL